MEKQYCKVGAVHPIPHGSNSISLLEYQYKHFMNKAAMDYADQRLRTFFEGKAQKIKRMLESLM